MPDARSPKVSAAHLLRNAVLYVRQSSPRQVLENRESGRRQYALSDRAVALGWDRSRIQVIDEDQGLTGDGSAERSGFQGLMGSIANGKVGIVLCLEISRLVRDSADWHQLLRVAALTDTLILDEAAVYDPRDSNDRLILGVKGTIFEYEMYSIKLRLHGGRVNKAKRGALLMPLPAGLEYDSKGDVALAADKAISNAIALVFTKFSELGSATAATRWFQRENIPLPSRLRWGEDSGEIHWRIPNEARVMNILRNPRYAGIYAYGRTQRVLRADGSRSRQVVPMEEWTARIPDAHVGYVDWNTYLANQAVLARNGRQLTASVRRAGVRSGSGLLQSIAICSNCGRHMKVQYASANPANGKPAHHYYICVRGHRREECRFICGKPVDAAVSRFVIAAMSQESIDLAMAVQKQVRDDFTQADARREERIEALRYEASLARRRHHAVDPDKRLVAEALEAEWNSRLQELEEARKERDACREAAEQDLSDGQLRQIRSLVDDFEAVWSAPATDALDRKRLLGYLVEDAILRRDGNNILVELRLRGGRTAVLDPIPAPIPSWKRRTTRPETVDTLDDLLETVPEARAAEELNRAGHTNWRGEPMTMRGVRNIVKTRKMKSWAARQSEKLRAQGFEEASELARKYGVTGNTIRTWAHSGILQMGPVSHGKRTKCLYRPPPGTEADLEGKTRSKAPESKCPDISNFHT